MIVPCFVDTVVPSIRGSKSLCTPSLLTSPPRASDLAQTLSISSRNTIPFCSTASIAARVTVSSSNNLSASSLIKTSWLSSTVIFLLTVLPPIALPNKSDKFIIPICDPDWPGISNIGRGLEVSFKSSSISVSSNSPDRNFFRNISLVASLASTPAIASSTRSSAARSAFERTSSLIHSRV